MAFQLVIVESPAKAKTIKKYLGKGFEVMASYGHVRDLIPKEGAVDTEHDFAMKYADIERNAQHIASITRAMKKADKLYLATDPDREGEAIAWHIMEILERNGTLKDKPCYRIVFHQITKAAIKKAVNEPRDISMDLVHAQQARRALDYLVGFTLSPLLWKKVRAGLSAGRVQSPAMRMIVEREEEIEKFVSQEYWTVHATLKKKKHEFSAKLIEYKGEKLEQFTITDEKQAKQVVTAVKKAAQNELLVDKVTKKERKRNPAAPFITSTLQQEASRKLGFSASRTMQIAQQLYEGIDMGDGPQGLITYMRTDSVTLAPEAIAEIRDCIAKRYGDDMVPDSPRMYKTKSKNAQEAHEAIRPTSAMLVPDEIKSYLNKDQLKLYSLIWKRTLASQMISATLNVVSIDLLAGKNHRFRASGSTIVNPGFLRVYEEGIDDKKSDDDEGILPPLTEGEKIDCKDIEGNQHFTEPPPRYTEASLVKALEEHGIGRPSTYASIIATLKSREYVEMDNKRFKATDVARVVSRFLTNYFTQYVDYDFTAKLEDQLDNVANGEEDWVPLLRHFWQPFKKAVDTTAENVQRSDVTQEKMDEDCPKCGKQLSIRLGRRGRFIGCSGFPECDYTRSMDGEEEEKPEVIDRKCPDCDHDLIIRHGRYGKFIGCSNYPKCKHIESLEQPKDTQVDCPQCKKGHMVQRRSRRGKEFYSCNRYPDCKYATWNEPLDEACPQCKWPMLTIKRTKRSGNKKMCPQDSCDYSVKYEEPEKENEDE